MDSLHMDRTRGTKWFTFYTKVRPWFACITTLTVITDFLQYVDVYMSYWWMMLYFRSDCPSYSCHYGFGQITRRLS